MAAKLIVIDGLDGSGKATQSELVTKELTNRGYKAIKISFPNYDSDSSSLVKMYLNGELGDDPSLVNAYAASSFYAVDRVASFIKSWKKDYEENDFIICDRYTTSNIIHQMPKLSDDEKKKYLDWLFDYEYEKLSIPKPDLVIFLDLDPDISQKLMSERYEGDENKKDIHEKNVKYLNQCRLGAKYAIDNLDWTVIDCSDDNNIKPIEEITKLLLDVILK